MMLTYNAEYLLPGHTRPIVGAENVREVLGNYRAAIETVLVQTLDCLNKGFSLDETVAAVKLPDDLATLPYLGEHYGSVEWSVRAIYQGYVGWFDGQVADIHPLSLSERAEELVPALGGVSKVTELIETAQAEGKWQWALELCEMALCVEDDKRVRELKIKSLYGLAKLETSANGRHYYLVTAHEMEA